MAFKIANLTRIANLFGLASPTDITPGFYAYVTTDTKAAVLAANYFNGIVHNASPNSIIMVQCADGQFQAKVTANDGTTVTVSDLSPVARGQATTVTASDTIVTGLGVALACVVVTEDSDPIDASEWVSASIGDQAGAPAAGSFLLKTWANTSGTDPTAIAATTFGKKVNWVAFAV